uniref:DUF4220 domain-containing protein n=1 Tax=Oryza brachyantha TaxID=4533 RepID=J3LBA9_ORYBR
MASATPSFPGMVRWWEEWQLRVLALSSLFLQLFLFVSATFRKYRIPPLLRSCVWLAYLGGDALAIYALATVFPRHRQHAQATIGGGSEGHYWGRAGSSSSASSMLEVMWVPVFLVHLGGQDSITAYNIEDNELWARHAVAMSSQAAVAVYVFWRSWSVAGGQVPERSPALSLFAAGFLKLGERLWALRRASITRLAAVRSSAACRSNDPLESYAYVQQARDYVQKVRQATPSHDRRSVVVIHPLVERELQDDLMELFIDFPAPYRRRLRYLKSFMALGDNKAYEELCMLLDIAFQFFYTKKEAAYTIVGVYLRTFSLLLGIAAIASFNDSNKDGFHSSDVVVSYILLCSTLVLEICALDFNYVDASQYCHPHHRWSTPAITKFIRGHLRDGWVGLYSSDDYRRFNDRRGGDADAGHPAEPVRRGLRRDRAHTGTRSSPPQQERARAQDRTAPPPPAAAAVAPGGHLEAARRLAGEMTQMNDTRRALSIISGVWVEMICYSASRCRGFLHAKSLGAGGEFLTVVWLLLHRMGMEGLADQLQRPELPEPARRGCAAYL